MSIYAISDLHLSFNTNKPMDIFGWNDYEEKISQDWRTNVKEEDLVLLPGDFSWETYLENTKLDFGFINNVPGKKLLLKGNHDLWWTTLKRMREFLKEKEFNNIDFIYNNSYEFENYIIAGTRGWNLVSENIDDKKIKDRELLRLENSIIDGIQKYGEDKPIIVCMHYPPLLKDLKNNEFTKILEKYNVKYCLYGHLHGKSHMNVFDGIYNNVNYKMVSCDYTGFKLIKII